MPYNALPHLTADLLGVGGRYKMRPEDFQVTEVPLYAPCGTGPHVYFTVTKKGIATMAAAAAIARALGVPVNHVGCAGLKDARAITTQWMSVEHVEPARLEALQLAHIRIGQITRHTNKLRTGHLAANRHAARSDVSSGLPPAHGTAGACRGKSLRCRPSSWPRDAGHVCVRSPSHGPKPWHPLRASRWWPGSWTV